MGAAGKRVANGNNAATNGLPPAEKVGVVASGQKNGIAPSERHSVTN